MPTAAAVLLLGATAACPTSPPPPPRPGPACRALLELADRGRGCDEVLASVAETVRGAPDEAACIRGARRLLAPPPEAAGEVHSVFTPAADVDASPLRAEELEALAVLEFPATLSVTPDIRAVPGVPPTRATLDGIDLTADAEGRLHASPAAGPRTLTLHHAGKQTDYCVELTACEPLALTSHASRLGKHARVHPGACPG